MKTCRWSLSYLVNKCVQMLTFLLFSWIVSAEISHSSFCNVTTSVNFLSFPTWWYWGECIFVTLAFAPAGELPTPLQSMLHAVHHLPVLFIIFGFRAYAWSKLCISLVFVHAVPHRQISFTLVSRSKGCELFADWPCNPHCCHSPANDICDLYVYHLPPYMKYNYCSDCITHSVLIK